MTQLDIMALTKEIIIPEYTDILSKVCSKCKNELLLEMFHKSKLGKHGRGHLCRACESLRVRKYTLKKKSRNAIWYKENREFVLSRNSIYNQNHKLASILNTARARAAKKGIPFLITKENLIILQQRFDNGVCELTGTQLDLFGKRSFNSPSIDRIDCHGGYTMDNIRIVCYSINVAMNTWGEDKMWQVFMNWMEKKQVSQPT